ncbi:MAG: hypothetical protein EBZ49_15355 [Proteobacteria bacterium]|nr:hypothetical protein [Pseudomonadota bacterium]
MALSGWNILGGFSGMNTPPSRPSGQPRPTMSPEEIAALQQQIELQNQQLEQERKKQELAKSAMPIQETVGPDGKKTIGLRPEFMLQGPEAYISREKERLGTEQAQALDQLQQSQAQQLAQQRASMASRGGLRGANPMLLSRYSMRDALAGQQGLLAMATGEKNLENLLKGVAGVEQFNLERWKKMKDVEASKTQAEATRAAGGSGSKK